MADLSVYGKVQSVSDLQRQKEELMMKQQLMKAQIGLANKQANEIDVDKLGERAFMKAAQGLQLTPQELAAAQFLDAKSGGVMFDQNTGALMQRPRLSDKINLPGMGQQQNMPQPIPIAGTRLPPSQPMTPDNAAKINALYGGGDAASPAPVFPDMEKKPSGDDTLTRISDEANRQRELARGNPRALQDITENENRQRLAYITNEETKIKSEAERYSKTLESTGLTELISAAERANNAVAGKGDIAGVGGMQAVVPDFLSSDDAVAVRQEIAGLKNAILKARSGGAVTPQEADRMMGELGLGFGRKDANIRRGIKNVTMMLQEKIKNAGAGYSDKAKNLYTDQGGTITKDRLAKYLSDNNSDPLGIRQ